MAERSVSEIRKAIKELTVNGILKPTNSDEMSRSVRRSKYEARLIIILGIVISSIVIYFEMKHK